MALDGLIDVLVVFGVDVAAILDGDRTVPVEVGVGTDVPGIDSADGRVLFMFWEPPCPTAGTAACTAFRSIGLTGQAFSNVRPDKCRNLLLTRRLY